MRVIADLYMKWNEHIFNTVNRTPYLVFIFAKFIIIVVKIYYDLFNSAAWYGIIACWSTCDSKYKANLCIEWIIIWLSQLME